MVPDSTSCRAKAALFQLLIAAYIKPRYHRRLQALARLLFFLPCASNHRCSMPRSLPNIASPPCATYHPPRPFYRETLCSHTAPRICSYLSPPSCCPLLPSSRQLCRRSPCSSASTGSKTSAPASASSDDPPAAGFIFPALGPSLRQWLRHRCAGQGDA